MRQAILGFALGAVIGGLAVWSEARADTPHGGGARAVTAAHKPTNEPWRGVHVCGAATYDRTHGWCKQIDSVPFLARRDLESTQLCFSAKGAQFTSMSVRAVVAQVTGASTPSMSGSTNLATPMTTNNECFSLAQVFRLTGIRLTTAPGLTEYDIEVDENNTDGLCGPHASLGKTFFQYFVQGR